MDLTAFRTNFPEFSNTTTYPDAQLIFWSTWAESMLNQCKFGTMWANAVMLYTAHEITLAAQNVQAAAVGGSPGQSGGIANSKTVGGVSVGYDSQIQSEKDAGWWNRTTYGQQLWRLIQMFGAGAIEL